jgi:hypothetical protein
MTTSGIHSGRDPIEGMPRTAQEQIRELKHVVVGQTRQALGQARDRAATSLAESKQKLADQVGGLASALRRTTDQLREEDRTTVANLTDAVAGRADRAANYLRQVNAGAVRKDLEGLARRRPALVLGGALALGLLAPRFFKSSERRQAAPRWWTWRRTSPSAPPSGRKSPPRRTDSNIHNRSFSWHSRHCKTCLWTS